MKTKLVYIGDYQPKGMEVEVERDEAEVLLKTGNWSRVEDKEEDESTSPDESWKEMEIYDWIQANNIPIKYRPASDTKASVLKKLRNKGYI